MHHIPGGRRESGAANKSLSKFMEFYKQNGFGMYILESSARFQKFDPGDFTEFDPLIADRRDA